MRRRLAALVSRAISPALSSMQLTLATSAVLVLVFNVAFWANVLELRGVTSIRSLLFLLSLFVFLVAVLNVALALIAFKHVQKPITVLILATAAVAAYFMNGFGVLIDSAMIGNVFETDARELSDFLDARMLAYLVFLGALPAVVVLRSRVRYRGWIREIGSSAVTVLLSIMVAVLAVLPFYADYLSLFDKAHGLRYRVSPLNYVVSTVRYFRSSSAFTPVAVEKLGEDAVVGPVAAAQSRRSLSILVLGETARAQQFSLNGYPRETNPRLSKIDAVNFDNVTACGTSTAVSLPCMFSNQTHDGFSSSSARRQEGLLDVLNHAGINVLWRDNNSGCKGVCDRIDRQELAVFESPQLCSSGECFDEVLLSDLDGYVESVDGDVLIVLHQKGSHGPAYASRYPKAFERYTPVCASGKLDECTAEEVVNAYDNTILYTDYFLSRVIAYLEARSAEFNTAMIYISDHGESLGENHLYLHGVPYFLASQEQTWVPLVVWLSTAYERAFAVDHQCLSATRDLPLSHDNLFHSVLGLMDVRTAVYDAGLDIFSRCRSPAVPSSSPAPAPTTRAAVATARGETVHSLAGAGRPAPRGGES